MLLKSNFLLPSKEIEVPKEYIVSTDDIIELIPKRQVNSLFDISRKNNIPLQDLFLLLMKTNWSYAASVLFSNEEYNFELLPFQHVILDMMRNTQFPLLIASRGASKSFLLAVFAILKAIFDQTQHKGIKIVIVGSSFRQSKQIFSYIEECLSRSSLLRAACPNGVKNFPEKVELKVGNSVITAIPLGTGQSVRGLRANVILADEMSSIPKEVFDIVVRGFAAVSKDPVTAAKQRSKIAKVKDKDNLDPNQVIISGTAYFQNNHFYGTYTQYKTIIENKIQGFSTDYPDIFGRDVSRFEIDYKKFAIIKLPYDKLPEGFLDKDQLANAGIGMKNNAWFNMEYKTVFASDAGSFFTMSSIERNTPQLGGSIDFGIPFCPETLGDKNGTYVMGIDPARLQDNFAIVIGKIKDGKLYVVHCKTYHKTAFPKTTTASRDLVDDFGIKRIHMDAGGGGETVKDIFCDNVYFPDRELILDMDDKDMTEVKGRHILRMISFSNIKWLEAANYNLKSDLDTNVIKWPSYVDDSEFRKCSTSEYGKLIQDSEDSLEEINKIKVELSKIERTYTDKAQRAHFDVPKELRTTLRKDRYSALLLMVDAARVLMHGDLNSGDEKELPFHGAVGSLSANK